MSMYRAAYAASAPLPGLCMWGLLSVIFLTVKTKLLAWMRVWVVRGCEHVACVRGLVGRASCNIEQCQGPWAPQPCRTRTSPLEPTVRCWDVDMAIGPGSRRHRSPTVPVAWRLKAQTLGLPRCSRFPRYPCVPFLFDPSMQVIAGRTDGK
ncbi:hypothetical protein QBC41DRAFT_148789 [Cercophora samala]|uniref:Uncharacterized protein n=1 Tax=Cercophora samala TaxID=330535 RepID=A0AA39Z980_9PEZI|nr:hypothetical protein QBC41DRAFT_148789 [Cercophora samala]